MFRGTIFVFTTCLKQIFLDTTEFGGYCPRGYIRKVYYINAIYTKSRHDLPSNTIYARASEEFFQGGGSRAFPKIFSRGGPKVVKFVFFLS